ncbi:MAG TPA: HRDC domain-containing protein [Wenzhouxiangella sp.]|nr:HRDC domain-containing protein [Wenzhouxiangella sp.]
MLTRQLSADFVKSAKAAVANATLLTSPAIEEMLHKCSEAPAIGIDTEFVRERTFYPRPGLVQISNGRQVWLLDAVAVESSPLLGELLDSKATTKILHSVGEDLEILRMVGGRWPQKLFDTQVAAAMLGQPLQIRYESLAALVLGIEPDGGRARSNWRKRPLAPELLQYAAEDVIWLPALKDRLSELLEQAGRLDWLREDCRRLVERARAGDTTPPITRVKGAGRLPTADLAFVDALSRWRESMARQRDLPRRFVLGDDTLLDFARLAAAGRFGQALGKLTPKQRRSYSETLEKAVGSVNPDRFQLPATLRPFSPEEREQLRTAQKIVRDVAARLEVEPALLASKRELARLVRGEYPDWLHGWRKDILSDPLRAASVNISDLAETNRSPGSSAG